MELTTGHALSAFAVTVSLFTFYKNWSYQRKTKSLEMTFNACNYLLGRLDQIESLYKFSSQKPYTEWTEDERKIARDICGAFHLIGILADQGLVPGDLLTRIWYYSIPRCHECLQGYLEAIRTERGDKYWIGFDLLVERARLNRKRTYR